MDSDDPLDGPLVLNPQVLLTDADTYPEELRARIGAAPDDMVLSLMRSRYASQRIDSETARFLRRFEGPTSVVEAVIAEASETGEDPASLLDAIFPLVSRFASQRVLISPADAEEPAGTNALQQGSKVLGHEIISSVESETETEIYSADGRGGPAVVKHVPPSAPEFVKRALKVERAVLRLLGNKGMEGVPRVLAAGNIPTGNVLVLGWQEGSVLERFSARRTLPAGERLRLCINLAERYRDLHQYGFLHGDVHGRNVVVDQGLVVRLIDFGGALRIGRPTARARMALLPDLEPEAAREVLAGRPPPLPSCAGEQYCLAALIFSVLAGKPPISLSLETLVAMGQIASTPPRALRESGLHLPQVEDVLAKALSKDPGQRFASVGEFAAALKMAASAPRRSLRSLERCDPPSILEVYGLDGALIQSPLPNGARAGLYYGAAGIAYALSRAAILGQDAEALAAADIWVERALSDAAPEAYEWPEIGVTHRTIGRDSPFNGRAGVRLTEAIVRILSADPEAALSACLEIASGEASGSETSDFEPSLDLLHGAAGRLIGIAHVIQGLPIECRRLVVEAALRLRSGVERSLLKRLRGMPTGYLGVAHGMAGAALALLRFAEAADQPPGEVVLETLERLGELARSTSNRIGWPVEAGGSEQGWTGWCHGNAGHLILWCTAARALGDERHWNRAIDIGRALSRAPACAAPTLCCGAPGEALALFSLGQLTGDDGWFDEGRKRLARGKGGDPQIPAPHSLFRGSLGMMLARLEAATPERSVWPFCTPLL